MPSLLWESPICEKGGGFPSFKLEFLSAFFFPVRNVLYFCLPAVVMRQFSCLPSSIPLKPEQSYAHEEWKKS